MFSSVFDEDTLDSCSSLEFVLDEVFFPVSDGLRPATASLAKRNRHALACAAYVAACAYNEYIDHVLRPDWLHITKMLDNLRILDSGSPRLDDNLVVSQVGGMEVGGRI